MTKPRRKEWLFDVSGFWNLFHEWDNCSADYDPITKSAGKIEDFIQSEIKRNVCEFAKNLSPKQSLYAPNEWQTVKLFKDQIEAAIKDYK